MRAQDRNPALDAVRATAILSVFAGHVVPEGHGWWDVIADVSQRGVDLFFVLSGYLVGGIAIREVLSEQRLDVPQFWWRRWMRTLPAYYVTLALYIAKQQLPHESIGLGKTWAYALFFQSYAMPELKDFAHSWSLCVEEHFYLVLPLLLAAMGRFGWVRAKHALVGITAIGCAFLTLRLILSTDTVINQRLSHLRTDGLSVGVALAAMEQHHAPFAGWVRKRAAVLTAFACSATAAAVAIQLNLGPRWWQTAYAIAFGVWVALAAAHAPAPLMKAGAWRPVAFIARVSYSMYLLHLLVIGTLNMLFVRHRALGPAAHLTYVAVALGASLFVAAMSYRFVEQPFLRLRDRRPATSPAA